jgi:hypothetical protein
MRGRGRGWWASKETWAICRRYLRVIYTCSSLIERSNEVPEWDLLMLIVSHDCVVCMMILLYV